MVRGDVVEYLRKVVLDEGPVVHPLFKICALVHRSNGG